MGAVAVLDDAMIARDHDRILLQRDPTAHAVLLTLQGTARKLESRRLNEVTIFTTHEPCAMCVGALVETEVFALVYAVPDEERGAAGSAVELARSKALPHQRPWSPACARRRLGGWQPRRRPTPERPAGRPGIGPSSARLGRGEVSEWFKVPLSKSVCDEHWNKSPIPPPPPPAAPAWSRPRRGRLEAYGAALEMRFGETRRGFESPSPPPFD